MAVHEKKAVVMALAWVRRLAGLCAQGARAGLLGMAFVLTGVAQASVTLPNGEFTWSAEDLRVKVLGGVVSVKRSWANGQWYVNPAWADLKFTLDGADGGVSVIDRAGAQYARTGNGLYVFDQRFFIRKTVSGYQWYDRQGNTIDYDAAGRILGYADRNGVKVSFEYDASGNRSRVLDHHGQEVLSFTYVNGWLTALTDRTGRKVQYKYLSENLVEVVDVLGNSSTYTYDGNHQVLTLKDAEGRTTTVSYATSVAPPPGANASLKSTAGINPVTNGNGVSTSSSAVTVIRPPLSRVGTVTDALGKTTTYQADYDRVARRYTVTTITPMGAKTTGVYNGDGRMLSQQTGSRTTRQLQFDINNTETTLNERGLATRIQYDDARRPLTTWYPDGTQTKASYDASYGNVLEATDEEGTVTQYSYDSKGNLTQMTEAVGLPVQRVTKYDYDSHGQKTGETRVGTTVAEDATTTFTYDGYGNLASVTDPLGKVTTFAYDVMGNVLTRTDALNQTTTYQYDLAGRQTKRTDALDHSVTLTYDKVGNPLTSTDALGNVTTLTYDKLNRRIKVSDPAGGIRESQYDDDGRLTALLDQGTALVTLTYDGDGRLSGYTDGNGNTTSYEYGAAGSGLEGLLTATVYPSYREEYKYDPRDRKTQTIRVLDANTRHTTTTGFDGVGRPVSTTDALGRSTISQYDALGRLIQTTDAGNSLTSFSYDPRDNLLSVTDANGNVTRYAYDKADQRTSETKAAGGVIQYEFDAVGNLKKRTDALGQERRYTYDAAKRLTLEEHYPVTNGVLASTPAKTISYSYDAADRLTGYDDGTTQGSYTLDGKGRKTAETISYGAFQKTTSTAYQANGLKQSVTDPDGVVTTYTYDANRQLKTLTVGGKSLSIDSYQWTKPAQETLPGLTRNTTYDALLRPTEIKVTKSNQTQMDHRYGYDAINLTSKQTLDGTTTYGYDTLDRLTQATPPASLQAAPNNLPVEQYSYDAVHNRTSSLHQPGGWSYGPDNQLISYGQGTEQTSLEYDANGHQVKRTVNGTVTQYRYDAAERLIEIADGNGVAAANYAYDPFGRRIKKTVGGQTTYYQYADEGLVAEYDQAGTIQTAYGWLPGNLWGTSPVVQRKPNAANQPIYFYHNDHLGTPQQITDVTGNVVWLGRAEAFGRTNVDAASTVTNPFRFPGQYEDAESGLHQNFRRDYDANIGRYIESDPIGVILDQSEPIGAALYLDLLTLELREPDAHELTLREWPQLNHRHAYVNGNPTAEVDPEGLGGERGYGRGPNSTGNAGKHWKDDPKNPGWGWQKNPQTGDRVYKRRPPYLPPLKPPGGGGGYILPGLCSQIAVGILLLVMPGNAGQCDDPCKCGEMCRRK
jgi:RHS repeat-associated protein